MVFTGFMGAVPLLLQQRHKRIMKGETMITSEKPLTATQVRRGTYINTGSKDVGPDPDWNAKENTYKGTNYIQDADKAVWIRSSSTK